MLDGKNVLSPRFVYGTWFSNQLVGLGDGHKSLCDHFNTDLSSVIVSPSPHLFCEVGEGGGPLEGCNYLEVGFNVALFSVAGPSFPIFFPCFVIMYSDSIGSSQGMDAQGM